MAWWDATPAEANDSSVHARNDPTGYVRLLLESSEEDDKNTHAAIFDMRFGKKAEEAVTDPRERKADSLFNDLEFVASAIVGNDSNNDDYVPTSKCVDDTKKRQLVTRSGLRRLGSCVCHLYRAQAMKAPYRVGQFFKTVLQKEHYFKVDVIAGDANTAAYKYYKKQEYQDLYNSSVAVMLRERCNMMST